MPAKRMELSSAEGMVVESSANVIVYRLCDNAAIVVDDILKPRDWW